MLAGGKHRFRPRLIPTLITLALLPLLIDLGFWQLHRADEKRALFASFDTAAPETVRDLGLDWTPADLERVHRYAWVTLSGEYDAAHQILLEDMVHDGQVGYHVLTPFTNGAGQAVLVDRGWHAAGDTDPADLTVGSGPRKLRGRVDEIPASGLHLAAPLQDDAPWPRRMLYPTRDELGAALGRNVAGRIIRLDPAAAEGFVRQWRPDVFPPARHVAYAVQWFALAAALVIIWFVVNWRRVATGDTD